jgi:hypothetical protein
MLESKRFTKEEVDLIVSILEVVKRNNSYLLCSECETIDKFISIFDGFYEQYEEYREGGISKERISCELEPHFLVKMIR